MKNMIGRKVGLGVTFPGLISNFWPICRGQSACSPLRAKIVSTLTLYVSAIVINAWYGCTSLTISPQESGVTNSTIPPGVGVA